MKRLLILLFTALVLSGCEETNLTLLTDAATDAVTAITLTDENVSKIARQAAQESDSTHWIAPFGSEYDQRLRKLVSRFEEHDGYDFNFKVYLTSEVNAFAMADGTIRVYSGLMDLMSDEELLFVIGHEIGHVVKQHSREKVVIAYASSAIRKGLSSQENELGQVARSVLGTFALQLTNAQFSQHEERQADNYGVQFLLGEGYQPHSAVSALNKLAELAKRHTFLSSHPNPEERANRIARGEYGDSEQDGSLLATLFTNLKQFILWVVNIIIGLVKSLLSLI